LPTLALRAFRVPPHPGSCARVTPDSLSAIASFASQRVACRLSFGAFPDSLLASSTTRPPGAPPSGQPSAKPKPFGSGKNGRSSPPSAMKNVNRSFRSRRASAQPTAGRPLAGRLEATRWRRRGRQEGLHVIFEVVLVGPPDLTISSAKHYKSKYYLKLY
jgi:hypothetical protein